MRLWTTAIAVLVAMLAAPPLWAAAQYGQAVVEKGEMVVLREGRRLNYEQSATGVPIQEQDLIRVQENSRVILKSREKATITLGANAVFHVKPFETPSGSGFLRALFGRFRASIVGLVGGERFNVKTATATIGVKGTEYRTSVHPHGETMVIGENHDPDLSGLFGPGQSVNPGQMSFVMFGIQATSPIEVPQQVLDAFGSGALDAPGSNTPGAGAIPGIQALIELGLITPEQLEQGQSDGADDLGGLFDGVQFVEFDLDSAKENLFRGDLDIRFQ